MLLRSGWLASKKLSLLLRSSSVLLRSSWGASKKRRALGFLEGRPAPSKKQAPSKKPSPLPPPPCARRQRRCSRQPSQEGWLESWAACSAGQAICGAQVHPCSLNSRRVCGMVFACCDLRTGELQHWTSGTVLSSFNSDVAHDTMMCGQQLARRHSFISAAHLVLP